MSKVTCPAGGEHVFISYNTELFGAFVACNKCGVRDEDRCAIGGTHSPVTVFDVDERGRPATIDRCTFCRKRM